MADLQVTITKQSDGSVIYTKTSNGIGQVGSDGTISFPGMSPQNVSIEWVLSGFATGVTFADSNAFTIEVPSGLFAVTSGQGTGRLTVQDDDGANNLTGYAYCLALSDGSNLDPRIINR